MSFKREPGTGARETCYTGYIRMKLLFIVFLISAGACVVSAGLFGPDPTPEPTTNVTSDVWQPVDKWMAYQPDFSIYDGVHKNGQAVIGGVKYFITYENQYGHHEIREVDIDTWYNMKGIGISYSMYLQGGK